MQRRIGGVKGPEGGQVLADLEAAFVEVSRLLEIAQAARSSLSRTASCPGPLPTTLALEPSSFGFAGERWKVRFDTIRNWPNS